MSSYRVKIVLVGAAAVGKTSLLQRFIKEKYFISSDGYKVGIDVLIKDIEYAPGEIASLSLWELGFEHRIKNLRDTFFKKADGALILFSLAREMTYTVSKKWLKEVRQFAGKDIPFILVGTKADLIEEIGVVIEPEEISAFVKKEGGIYIETSSKTGLNVEKVFIDLTRKILKSKEFDGIKEVKPEINKKEKQSELEEKLLIIKKEIQKDSPGVINIQAIKDLVKIIELVEYHDLMDLKNKSREILALALPRQDLFDAQLQKFDVFLSYSTIDSDLFRIPEIASRLKKYPEINNVFYWEKNSGQSIIKFMDEKIEQSEVFIQFCSQNSKTSKSVQLERNSAIQLAQQDRIRIIPVFLMPSDMPAILTSFLGVECTLNNFDDFIERLHKETLRR